MKSYLLVIMMIAATWGALPAQADVGRDSFKLSNINANQPQPKKDFNDLIFLKARVKELELEVESLKKIKTSKTFGNAYVNDKGELKLKSTDGGSEWDWDGNTWTRPFVPSASTPSFVVPAGGVPFNSCPNGRCPLPR